MASWTDTFPQCSERLSSGLVHSSCDDKWCGGKRACLFGAVVRGWKLWIQLLRGLFLHSAVQNLKRTYARRTASVTAFVRCSDQRRSKQRGCSRRGIFFSQHLIYNLSQFPIKQSTPWPTLNYQINPIIKNSAVKETTLFYTTQRLWT